MITQLVGICGASPVACHCEQGDHCLYLPSFDVANGLYCVLWCGHVIRASSWAMGEHCCTKLCIVYCMRLRVQGWASVLHITQSLRCEGWVFCLLGDQRSWLVPFLTQQTWMDTVFTYYMCDMTVWVSTPNTVCIDNSVGTCKTISTQKIPYLEVTYATVWTVLTTKSFVIKSCQICRK